MTDDLQSLARRLAERARDHHLRACGLTPWPWSTMSVDAQRAWVSTVALVISEATRDAQRFRWTAENQPDIDWTSDPDNQIVVWSVSGHGYRGRTLGDAIDAAMKGGGGES